MAKELLGKEVAAALKDALENRVEALKEKNVVPTLAILRVGEKESDLAYERGASKKCESLGIDVKKVVLLETVPEETLINAIEALNEDESVHGVLLFRPLPEHLNYDRVCNALSPQKDVDAMTTVNSGLVYDGSGKGFPPCTAQAVMEILNYYQIPIKGAKVTLVGWGPVVGKPLSVLLLNEFATVTVCHIYTKDAVSPCKDADILISAAGKADLITKNHMAAGQVVIDVGINPSPQESGKIVGDVSYEDAKDIVSAITPVPGGVGSVTTSVLAKHVIMAAEYSVKSASLEN